MTEDSFLQVYTGDTAECRGPALSGEPDCCHAIDTASIGEPPGRCLAAHRNRVTESIPLGSQFSPGSSRRGQFEMSGKKARRIPPSLTLRAPSHPPGWGGPSGGLRKFELCGIRLVGYRIGATYWFVPTKSTARSVVIFNSPLGTTGSKDIVTSW